MTGDLITLDRLLDALNKLPLDMEQQEIDKYTAAISSASAAIRAYTDRDFTVNDSGVATARLYEYDDSGYIDIDDAQSVTGVAVSFPQGYSTQTLLTSEWQAQPFGGPVFDSVVLYTPTYFAMSPEMGFTYNLDRFEGPIGPPPTVEVTAVWGWTVIPEDVQQAAVWTSAAFAEEARQVTNESIEGFSRSMNILAPTALPLRARDLLDQYRRISV